MTSPPTLEVSNGRIQTRFGEFDLVRPDVVTFPEGIPGFEQCQRFVLILADELSPLSCLQALDPPFPSFLAATPAIVRPDYRTELSPTDRFKLGVTAADPVLWLLILTIGLQKVTANLKAPVVINARKMIGRQVFIDDEEYSVNWPIETR